MKIFITLVGLITLWSTSLNSGTTYKIWVPPTIPDKQATIMSPLQMTTNGKTTVVQMVNSEELECMSKNIYFEAAMESTAGKLAVAQVTMNRVRSHHYPNTVCKVITQGKHYSSGFPVKDRCQFSWYCDGASDEVRNLVAFNTTQKIANLAMISYGSMKSQGLDYTEGAIYYHTYEINPRWSTSYPKVGRIGDHIFYR